MSVSVSCSAVILIAGTGSRFSSDSLKQYCSLKGRPLWVWSATAFQKEALVKEIVVVADLKYEDEIRYSIKEFKLSKVVSIVQGGARRQDSVLNGCNVASEDVVLLHDGARPFPPASLKEIVEFVSSRRTTHCAGYASPVTDTIRDIKTNRVVSRDHLMKMQTPQVAGREQLMEALRYCLENNISVTDDLSALEIIGLKIKLFDGPLTNIKVTRPFDLNVAEMIASSTGFTL